MNAFATLADLHFLAPVAIGLIARLIGDTCTPSPPTRIIINVVCSPGAVVIVAQPEGR